MSAIFYHSEEQKTLAEKTKDEHQKKLTRTIQTKIKKADIFYDAEDYHQKYMLRQQRNLLSSLGFSDKEILNGHAASRLNGYVGGFGTAEDLQKEVAKLGLNETQVKLVQSRLR
ncbi:peptide methionine sulfoxide reductase-like [Amphiura filiformis]|uniref:peptide methionine sulfoxide reductase-like n=1 Tax=Amphiura filiformis TaxID=82378 RepID=UPI003B227844